MYSIVNLYSDKIGEISRFLSNFYNSDNLHIENELKWEKKYFFSPLISKYSKNR